MQPLTYASLKTMANDTLIASIDEHLEVGADSRAQLLSQELANRKQESLLANLTKFMYAALGFLFVLTIITVVDLQTDSSRPGPGAHKPARQHR